MYRKVVFANGEIYHVFNRGIEKRTTFINQRELKRAVETMQYYRFTNLPLRFSHFLQLDNEMKSSYLKRINAFNKTVDIVTYCFMPNHFHFLLRQVTNNGISEFISKFTNSYTKYFNTKHKRIGPLFQGSFKAVHMEDDNQLIHVSRYIHLNPVSAFLIDSKHLHNYFWSSYPYYVDSTSSDFIDKETILNFYPNIQHYKQFIFDQADYARTLANQKHLLLE
jgi:REP-associated tyrosine transposase